MRLRITLPDKAPFEVDVPEDQATIGRGPECDVVIPDPFVSKAHLRLFRGLVVLDLGSSNGTFLGGGERVEGGRLVPEGKLSIGPDNIRIEVLDAKPDSTGGESAKLRELQAINAGLQQELEQARNESDFLRTQVETMRKAEATRSAVEQLSKAQLRRQGTDLDEFERLTSAYTEALKKLQENVDRQLEKRTTPY